MSQLETYEQCLIRSTHIAQPEIIKDDERIYLNNRYRVYELSNGDIFWLNDKCIESLLNTSIKRLILGKEVLSGVICIEKTKRRHWWQFWKKKYTGARFMYVDKEN